jgi:hypothetical protein
MNLPNWLANRWLAPHGIAYNAALQLATLALAAEGYRPARDRAHERAILSLRFTIGTEAQIVDTIDAVRRKRSISDCRRIA